MVRFVYSIVLIALAMVAVVIGACAVVALGLKRLVGKKLDRRLRSERELDSH